MSGEPFAREKTLTAAVWRGGDRPTGGASDIGVLVDELRQRDGRLCELLTCLTTHGGAISAELERRLQAAGVDLDHVRKCLKLLCQHGDRATGQGC